MVFVRPQPVNMSRFDSDSQLDALLDVLEDPPPSPDPPERPPARPPPRWGSPWPPLAAAIAVALVAALIFAVADRSATAARTATLEARTVELRQAMLQTWVGIASDPGRDPEERIGAARFLIQAADDPTIAAWATGEVARLQSLIAEEDRLATSPLPARAEASSPRRTTSRPKLDGRPLDGTTTLATWRQATSRTDRSRCRASTEYWDWRDDHWRAAGDGACAVVLDGGREVVLVGGTLTLGGAATEGSRTLTWKVRAPADHRCRCTY